MFVKVSVQVTDGIAACGGVEILGLEMGWQGFAAGFPSQIRGPRCRTDRQFQDICGVCENTELLQFGCK